MSFAKPKDDVAIFTLECLKHIYAKQDKREQYAPYIKAALKDPYEVYLSEYSDGKNIEFRKTYIGFFKDIDKKEDIFIVLRKEKDSSIFWNAFERGKGIDKLRKGTLLYKK